MNSKQFGTLMTTKSILMLVITFLILALVFQATTTEARPFDMWAEYRHLIPKGQTECDTTDSVDILCQKCAKQTKSHVVYPMCCQNQEDAQDWCQRYMSFGLQ